MPKAKSDTKTKTAAKPGKPKPAQIASYDAKTEKPKGRPAGSKNEPCDMVEASVTTCRKCGSTKRTPYFPNPRRPVNGVVWRKCRCLECRQVRIDVYREQIEN